MRQPAGLRARRTAPFLLAGALALALVPLPPTPRSWNEYAIAVLIALVIAASVFVVPWPRLPEAATAIPPLAFFVVVGLVRDADGFASGFGVLVLLPVVWLALYGTRRQLAAAVGATFLVFGVPILAVGGPLYPRQQWTLAILWLLATAALGFSTRRLVQRLTASDEKVRAVLRELPDSIIVVDADRRVEMMSDIALQTSGFRIGELLEESGDVQLRTLDGARIPLEDWPLARALRGERVSMVVVLTHGDAPPSEREVAALPLTVGGRRGAISVARDVGERMRRERYLAAEHDVTRLLAAADADDDALWDAVVKTIGDDMTGADAAAFWKFADGRLRCRAFWHADGFDPGEFEALTRRLELAPGEGLPGIAFERGEDVSTNVEHQLADPLRFPRAEAAAAAGLYSDIAVAVASERHRYGAVELWSRERRDLDPELVELTSRLTNQLAVFLERIEAEQDARRVKDEFIALVSHELRTPLTSIVGYLELLGDGEQSDLRREYLEIVARNADRMLLLITDLLLVAQIQAGRLSLQNTVVDLEEVAARCCQQQTPVAEDRGVTLDCSGVQPARVVGDGRRLGQIIDNLVGNALKFTPRSGRVDVRVFPGDAAGVVLEVADTGIGIPETDHDRIFERFFRSSTAAAAAVPGTGLGLPLVKALVEAHGGSIDFTSADGAGTTFRVELPAAEAAST